MLSCRPGETYYKRTSREQRDLEAAAISSKQEEQFFPVGAVAALAHILSKRRRKRSRHTDLKLCWGLLDVIFVGFLFKILGMSF